ncbi:MAG TPA: tetratricopeptide repeat protein [Cyclobacteriaceae bacterium]
MKIKSILFLLSVSLALFSCSPKKSEQEITVAQKKPVLTSLSGKSYYEPAWSVPTKNKLDSNLAVATTNFDSTASEENYIWLGRRLSYLYQYDSAVKIFSEGISKYPKSYRLYRHRGHRYITLRDFDNGVNDLKKASDLMKGSPIEIEPDGAPNKLNIPLSNTQFNVWYHLGLAYYLKGDFAKAEQAYLECLKVSDNDDLITATVDWLYMTYQRENKKEEAKKLLERINDQMTIVENDSYFNRLKMYQGKLKPEEVLVVSDNVDDADLSLATQGYGVGNWYLYNGDPAKAKEIFEKVTDGKHFAAFGFIAAETELSRMK